MKSETHLTRRNRPRKVDGQCGGPQRDKPEDDVCLGTGKLEQVGTIVAIIMQEALRRNHQHACFDYNFSATILSVATYSPPLANAFSLSTKF